MSAEVTLTEAEREALDEALWGGRIHDDVPAVVAGIVTDKVWQARAEERKRCADAIEDELAASANYMTPSERKGAHWAARVVRRA